MKIAYIYSLIFLTAISTGSASNAADTQNDTSNPSVEIQINENAQTSPTCEFIMSNAAKMIQHSQNIRVGVFNDVFQLLQESGVSSRGIAVLSVLFEHIFKESYFPVLRQISTRLMVDLMLERQNLTVCVGEKSCVLNDQHFIPSGSIRGKLMSTDQAGFASVETAQDNFEVTDNLPDDTLTAESAKTILENFDGLKHFDVMFLRAFDPSELPGFEIQKEPNGDESMMFDDEAVEQTAQWLGHLSRDIVKNDTLNFISDWIEANLKLIAKGKESDIAFYNYVRVTPDGRIMINRGFLQALVISRGAEARIATELQVVMLAMKPDYARKELINTMQSRYISGAYHDLVQALGEKKVRQMGIHPGNVLEYSRNKVKQMADTIEKSENL